MVLDLVLHLDETVSIYGVVAIFDMNGVTWQHGLQMTPTIIKRYLEAQIENEIHSHPIQTKLISLQKSYL